ncbi:MAG: hypothetical protein GXP37_12570 [Chloroflexi bacterium]|nr:hypothetical protein [Chloroflexota bacterium]
MKPLNPRPILLTVAVLMMFVLSACGGTAAPATTAPTATPVPATNTPLPPTNTPVPATNTPVPEPTATPVPQSQATSQPAAEQPADSSSVAKISALLDSYHSQAVYEIEITYPDQTSKLEHVSIQTDWIKADNPYGFDMKIIMDNGAAAGDAPELVSIYAIDDTAYIGFGGQWLTSSRQDAQLDDIPFFINTDDFVSDLNDLQRIGKETVNGIDTIHYTFDKSSALEVLLQSIDPSKDGNIDSFAGDMWVADPDEYVVKMTFQAEMSDVPDTDEAGTITLSDQKIDWTYELTDINGDFSIEVPEEAPRPGEVSLTGFAPGEFPIPADTTTGASMGDLVQLTSSLSEDEINAFYDEALAGLGWEKQESFAPTWTKDGFEIMIFTTPNESGGVDIMVMGQASN